MGHAEVCHHKIILKTKTLFKLLPEVGIAERGGQELDTSGVEGSLVGRDNKLMTPGSEVTIAEEQETLGSGSTPFPQGITLLLDATAVITDVSPELEMVTVLETTGMSTVVVLSEVVRIVSVFEAGVSSTSIASGRETSTFSPRGFDISSFSSGAGGSGCDEGGLGDDGTSEEEEGSASGLCFSLPLIPFVWFLLAAYSLRSTRIAILYGKRVNYQGNNLGTQI